MFNDHDYEYSIGNLAFKLILYKKQNLTGYIQYYKKMVGQTQRPADSKATVLKTLNIYVLCYYIYLTKLKRMDSKIYADSQQSPKF